MENLRYEILPSKINDTTQEVKEKVEEVLKVDEKYNKILGIDQKELETSQ